MKKTDPEKKELFEIAENSARKAGAIIKRHFGREKKISYKGSIDLVTNVDFESEETIISTITSRCPDHDIITEETDITMKGSDYRWIIDPLDGTVNYAHDLPFAAVSIALEIQGTLEIGIVYNPMMNEFFSARNGEGALYNGKSISVSDITELDKSFLATGFPYDIRDSSNNNLPYFNHLTQLAQGVRRLGSAALDLCYCAMGRFDGYWEIKLLPWDSAAGSLIVTEAGGVVTDFSGKPYPLYGKEIVASNGRIHQQLIDEIQHVQHKKNF